MSSLLKCMRCGHAERWHHSEIKTLYASKFCAAGNCNCQGFYASKLNPRAVFMKGLLFLIIWSVAIISLAVIFTMWAMMVFAYGYDVAFIGDIGDNQHALDVRNALYKIQPDLIICLGDITYSNNFTWFKTKYMDLFPNVKCIIGNHDLKKGNVSMAAEAYKLFGQTWTVRVDNKLFVGMDSEQNFTGQYKWFKNMITKHENLTEVFINTHRPCNIQTDSRTAPVGLFKMCERLKELIPLDAKLSFIAGHHHIMAKTQDSDGDALYISGAGGAFRQECSKPIFSWCNDEDMGYLLFKIKNDKVIPKFYDVNGKMIYEVIKK